MLGFSRAVSFILLGLYGIYLWFQLKTHTELFEDEDDDDNEDQGDGDDSTEGRMMMVMMMTAICNYFEVFSTYFETMLKLF